MAEAPRGRDCGITTYARLAAGPCPPVLDLLLAMGGAMEELPVDAPERLDDAARALFGIASSQVPATVLVQTVRELGYRPTADAGPAVWLLDHVVRSRRGHPVLIAIALCELARRAGSPADVASDSSGWYVRFADADQPEDLISVGFGGIAASIATEPLRRHCAHELAFVVLSGLEKAHAREGDTGRAARASGLRALLPIARHA